MTTDPRDTPEARQHLADCRVLQAKLERFVFEDAEEPSTRVYENSSVPALTVVPTLDGTGRVKMTLDDLAALLGIPREQLVDPSEGMELKELL